MVHLFLIQLLVVAVQEVRAREDLSIAQEEQVVADIRTISVVVVQVLPDQAQLAVMVAMLWLILVQIVSRLAEQQERVA